MRRWLWDRRYSLLIVGVVVPIAVAAVAVLCFWSVIRPEWGFYLACYVVGFPAGILVVWGFQRGKEAWLHLGRRLRILLVCIAFGVLWCAIGLSEHDWSEACWMTAAVALFCGGYVLFSRTVDRVWFWIRGR
jgi:hypothetical protein